MFDISTAVLAVTLFEDVVLKFGFCNIMVVDDDIKFKGSFGEICVSLKIPVRLLAKHNAKGLYIERYN